MSRSAKVSNKSKPTSFEQELLWFVLDHDTLAGVMALAENRWGLTPALALEEFKLQWRCGRLSAARRNPQTGVADLPVDVEKLTPDQAKTSYDTFMSATEETFRRINEVGGTVGMSG